MSVDYGKDFDYARTRLVDSVVTLKKDGTPVYVLSVDAGNGTTVVMNCLNKEMYVNLDDLDLSPVKLGYANHDSGVCYLQRRPERRYRQGLRSSALYDKLGRGNVRILGKTLARCIRGIYPTLDSCIDSIENREVSEIAFCRDFCVGNKLKDGYTLKYKGRNIGTIDIQDGMPIYHIANKHIYLKESLEEALHV